MDISSQIDEMLELPYWIIDILPRQVPAEGGGQYFSVEHYILNSAMMDAVCQRFARLLLKINCYEDIAVCLADADECTDNPSPQTLVGWFLEQKPMNILLKSTGAMVAMLRPATTMSMPSTLPSSAVPNGRTPLFVLPSITVL